MKTTTTNIVLASLEESPAALELTDKELIIEFIDQYLAQYLLKCEIRRLEIPLNELSRIEFQQLGWGWFKLGGKILLQAPKIAKVFGTAGGTGVTLLVKNNQSQAAKHLIAIALPKSLFKV